MLCPNCATENVADAKFCGNCGTPLNAAAPEAEASAAPEAPAAPVAAAAPVPPAAPAAAAAPIPPAAPAPSVAQQPAVAPQQYAAAQQPAAPQSPYAAAPQQPYGTPQPPYGVPMPEKTYVVEGSNQTLRLIAFIMNIVALVVIGIGGIASARHRAGPLSVGHSHDRSLLGRLQGQKAQYRRPWRLHPAVPEHGFRHPAASRPEGRVIDTRFTRRNDAIGYEMRNDMIYREIQDGTAA